MVAGACIGGGEPARDRAEGPSTSPSAGTGATTTFTATTTTTAPSELPAVDWTARPDEGEPRAVVTPTGVVLPVGGTDGRRFAATTPCFGTMSVPGTPLYGAHVVLDPGHGGDELGAVGATGLTEAAVNLTIAEETARLLESTGATVALTRTADYRITLQTRAEIATRLDPLAFVSIHHNAEPDGPWPRPGSETYYQIESPDSKRLAGLLWEELVAAFSRFTAEWVADTDAGAKYRLSSSGTDYYGILRRTAGIPAVLSEAAFISNPSEEALLTTPEFQHAEAVAISRAIIRFVTTDDPGSGFTEPYPRSTPAGPGGGTAGCLDPPLS
ncbi:MAG: N-acetylmuramoyl-L-alanine amidase family protein [Acidimicrobiales bacterium]